MEEIARHPPTIVVLLEILDNNLTLALHLMYEKAENFLLSLQLQGGKILKIWHYLEIKFTY